MRERIREGAILLAVLGGVQLLWPLLGTFLSWSTSSTPPRSPSTSFLIENSLMAGGMLLSAGLVERRPRATLAIVLVAWCSYQISQAWSSSFGVLHGLFIKIVMLVTLVRALFAARQAERIRKKMITARVSL